MFLLRHSIKDILHRSSIMADLDDFFAKKDKKKKGTKKFSKANTDVIAQNLEETARKEQAQQDKDINMGEETGESVAQQVAETVREFPLQWTVSEPGSSAHSIYMDLNITPFIYLTTNMSNISRVAEDKR